MSNQLCVQCGKFPEVDDDGLCATCHYKFEADVREGIRHLSTYLLHWAEFEEWLVSHGRR